MPLDEAVVREHQIKRWARAKKEALMRGDLKILKNISRSRSTATSQTRHHDLQPAPS